MSSETGGRTDSILLPFLLTPDESEAEGLLSDLMARHAAPTVEAIVRSTLGRPLARELHEGGRETQDIEDIVGELNIRLLERLRRLRESPDEAGIGDFRSYVATSAYNACHSYVRAKYPNRTRLKNKLRYALTHHRDFALWEGTDGNWICGLSQWRGLQAPADTKWISETQTDLVSSFGRGQDDVIELLRAMFARSKAPVPMEDLVSLIARILGITDEPPGNDCQLEYLRPAGLGADPGDPLETEERRLYLKRLWNEIAALPVAQRVALLLGARDGERTSIAVLLFEIPIASLREIASAVAMPADEFARVLADLPLDDNAISRHLGVSRQQVISYRLSARRRLARRMKSSGQARSGAGAGVVERSASAAASQSGMPAFLRNKEL